MIDNKKIEKVRKEIKNTIKKQPMVIENEPQHSGDPTNTIQQDSEEREQDNEKRNQQ